MTFREELIFDAWTPIAFKRALGARTSPGGFHAAQPNWTGWHFRRLSAYKILQAYQDNAARLFLAESDLGKMEAHREYGDGALIVNTILSALLGETQTISTQGADEVEEVEVTDDSVQDGDGSGGGEDTPRKKTVSQPTGDAVKAQALEEWINQWWDDERGPLKVIETERNAIGLGDGVFSIGWSPGKNRPRIRCWDPGFYYPVLADGNEDDFPDVVHIAWEQPDPPPGKTSIRRLTWRLGPILPDVAKSLFNRTVIPQAGDVFDPITQKISRDYDWNDEPSNVTCYYSDATFVLDISSSATVYDLSGADGAYEMDEESGEPVQEIDLKIDFIPVVHMPNTVAILNHFGRSSLATVLQILDDLANADTDLQAASATTGTPPIALQGATLKEGQSLSYGPGTVFSTGDGTMSVLDTSKALDALLKYVEALLSRVSVNGRIPASVLGRVEPKGNLAGITLALSFAPLMAMINEMRLVRAEKYPLIFKFAQRLAIAGGHPDVPPDYIKTNLVLGSFLPQDSSTAVTEVTALLTAKAISTATAVKILIIAGFPIEDAEEEVTRIQNENFEAATELLAATGDEAAVFDYLGREQPPEPVRPPAPVVDPNSPPSPIDPVTGLPVRPEQVVTPPSATPKPANAPK